MDFKEAREERKLTLKQVAELAGYSIPTINALELEGRGSERLRQKLIHIYELKQPFDAQPQSFVEHRSEYIVEDWQARAHRAEKELAELRAGLRSLLHPANSDQPSEVPASPTPVEATTDTRKQEESNSTNVAERVAALRHRIAEVRRKSQA